MSQERYRRLTNNRTKVFCLIVIFFSVLNRAYPNLDFKTKIVQIHCNLSEIYYSEVDHSEFHKPDFGDFGQSIFQLVPSFRMLSYLSEKCSSRLIKPLGVGE